MTKNNIKHKNSHPETLAHPGAIKQDISYQEENLIHLMETHPENQTNHLSKTINITGKINIHALNISINKIIETNPNLRAQYQKDKNTNKYNKYIIPYNINGINPKIKILDIKDNTPEQQEKLILNLSTKPYKINEYPLIRCHLLQKKNNESVLILSMSHLIGDGYSAYLIFGLIQCIYNFIINPLPYTNKKYLDKFLFGLTELFYSYIFKPLALVISPNYQNWANQRLANIYSTTIHAITQTKLSAYNLMCQRQLNYIKNSDHPAYQYFSRLTQYAEFNPPQKINKNINKTNIHLFSTSIPEIEKNAIKALSKRYKAQTPRVLLSLYHLTLYHYAKKACAVRTLNYHRRKNEVYSIGYFAQDMISFCGNLQPDHNFQQIISGVKDHFVIQKNLDKQGLRPAQIPASICFNRAKSPLRTEFNYIQGQSFELNLSNLKTQSDNKLQAEGINETWHAPIKDQYGYNIELSMYINNTNDDITVQIMSAQHAYPESFAKDFYQTYLDNIKRVWFLNNTQLGTLCNVDTTSLILPDLSKDQEDKNKPKSNFIRKIISNPFMTACAVLAIISAVKINYNSQDLMR
jgi:hypothetical protein